MYVASVLPQLVLLGVLLSGPPSAERAPPIYNKHTMYQEFIVNVHNLISSQLMLIREGRKNMTIKCSYKQQQIFR